MQEKLSQVKNLVELSESFWHPNKKKCYETCFNEELLSLAERCWQQSCTSFHVKSRSDHLPPVFRPHLSTVGPLSSRVYSSIGNRLYSVRWLSRCLLCWRQTGLKSNSWLKLNSKLAAGLYVHTQWLNILLASTGAWLKQTNKKKEKHTDRQNWNFKFIAGC